MNKQEAINELIANAVCGEPKLYCDTHCPYYIEGKDCKRIGVNFELEEAVKVLTREGKK